MATTRDEIAREQDRANDELIERLVASEDFRRAKKAELDIRVATFFARDKATDSADHMLPQSTHPDRLEVERLWVETQIMDIVDWVLSRTPGETCDELRARIAKGQRHEQ